MKKLGCAVVLPLPPLACRWHLISWESKLTLILCLPTNTYTLKISLCSYHVTLHLQPRYIKTVDTSNCGPLTAHSCVSLSSKTLSCHNFMFRCMDKPSCISIFHILNTLSMTFTWNGLQPIFVKINMNDTLIWGPGAMVFQKTFLPVLLYRAMNNQLGKCPSLE